jgi:hypothetical protein
VDQGAVREVQGDCPGEHGSLDVLAQTRQIIDRLAMRDPGRVLLDDRPRVQLLDHVVSRGADDLDALLVGLAMGIRAGKGGQEGVVDVDQRHAEPLEEVAGEDLHVARQHDHVDIACEQLEQPGLGFGLAVRRHGDVLEGDAERAHVILEVGVVGGDQGQVGVEGAATPAPEQVEHAVLVAGDQDRHPLALIRVRHAPPHVKGFGDVQPEGLLELATGQVHLGGRELHPHEEAAVLRVGGVLVRADDVGSMAKEKARDRGDDPRAVGAGDQQAGGPLARSHQWLVAAAANSETSSSR